LPRILTAEYTPKLHLRLCTSPHAPSILHTNTESREIGLRYYKLENHNFVDVDHIITVLITIDGVERTNCQPGLLAHSSRMYVNFDVDILLLETRYEEVPRVTPIVMGGTPPLQLKPENFPLMIMRNIRHSILDEEQCMRYEEFEEVRIFSEDVIMMYGAGRFILRRLNGLEDIRVWRFGGVGGMGEEVVISLDRLERW